MSTPIPSKIDGSHDCPYRDEIHAFRRWQKIAVIVLSTVVAGIGGLSIYSLDVATRAGEIASDMRHIAERQERHSKAIDDLRTSDSRLEREGLQTNQQVLVVLGEMRAQLSSIDNRLSRVEDSNTPTRRTGRNN